MVIPLLLYAVRARAILRSEPINFWPLACEEHAPNDSLRAKRAAPQLEAATVLHCLGQPRRCMDEASPGISLLDI